MVINEDSLFLRDYIQFEKNLRRLDQVRGKSQETGSSSRKISGDWTKFEENLGGSTDPLLLHMMEDMSKYTMRYKVRYKLGYTVISTIFIFFKN